MGRRRGLLLLAGGLLLPRFATAQAPGAKPAPLDVLSTTAMVGDVVREIGGERLRVAVLMGPGVDPHLYKPTREDMARMLRSDIIFYSGLQLEGKMSDAFVRVARAGRPVYAVTELLPEQELIAAEGGHHDPHVWMDPRAWSGAAILIADSLARHDSVGAVTYRRNLDNLRARLAALDAYAARVIGSIPEERRVLVTAHDAFNYFARRYAMQVEGIQGLSTESEAGVRRMQELVELLVTRRIPVVFVESSVPERNVRALVEGAAARGHEVRIGGSLFSDAMGDPGTYEGTYIGMIDHNVTIIARGLGGDAPARGFQNRLAPGP